MKFLLVVETDGHMIIQRHGQICYRPSPSEEGDNKLSK